MPLASQIYCSAKFEGKQIDADVHLNAEKKVTSLTFSFISNGRTVMTRTLSPEQPADSLFQSISVDENIRGFYNSGSPELYVIFNSHPQVVFAPEYEKQLTYLHDDNGHPLSRRQVTFALKLVDPTDLSSGGGVSGVLNPVCDN